MDKLQDRILLFHPDTLFEVRKDLHLEEPGRIEESINLLDNWTKKQAHFTRHDFSRDYLERILIASKGSVERAKEKLDKLCTIRTLMPDSFNIINVRKDLAQALDKVTFAVLPRCTASHHRVYVYRLMSTDFHMEDLYLCFKYCTVICEYMNQMEYSKGVILIADNLHVKNLLNLMTNLNPIILSELLKIITDVYGLRLKQILFLSQSKAIERFLNFFKQFLSAKMADRIMVLRSYSELDQFVSKDILPSDLGGQEEPLNQLRDKWLDEFSSPESMENYIKMAGFKTNEDNRQKDKFNEIYMGMPGTFRTLNVD